MSKFFSKIDEQNSQSRPHPVVLSGSVIHGKWKSFPWDAVAPSEMKQKRMNAPHLGCDEISDVGKKDHINTS